MINNEVVLGLYQMIKRSLNISYPHFIDCTIKHCGNITNTAIILIYLYSILQSARYKLQINFCMLIFMIVLER